MRHPISRAVGRVLGAVFAAIQAVRSPRPIHPRGTVLDGYVTWLGTPVRSGLGWVDEPPAAPQPVVARLSRSIGLPDAARRVGSGPACRQRRRPG